MSNISISASLAAIALTTIATIAPANAQGQSSVESNQSYLVSPRQLVSLARQGRFKAQGIPSHNNFRNGVRGGKITAADLVESAIANNRLPENARSNQQYLSTLASHLKSGGCGS